MIYATLRGRPNIKYTPKVVLKIGMHDKVTQQSVLLMFHLCLIFPHLTPYIYICTREYIIFQKSKHNQHPQLSCIGIIILAASFVIDVGVHRGTQMLLFDIHVLSVLVKLKQMSFFFFHEIDFFLYYENLNHQHKYLYHLNGLMAKIL